MKGRIRHIALAVVIIIVGLLSNNFMVSAKVKDIVNYDGVLRTVYCSSSKEIQNALKDAKAGDKIIIAEGSYTGAWMTNGYYYSSADGTKDNPIIIESENPEKPSELVGLRNSSGYVLYLTGDNWIVNDLNITNGQKGIMIDNGNNNLINNCRVYGVTQEGVHFRDGSSNNMLLNSHIYNTGITGPGFGEGVYIGSDKGKWEQYKKECDNNTIRNTTIGPNVRAEHIDIKEGTTGTIVENSIFKGTGISGENYSDSFIDVKGNKAIIRNNIGFREGNTKVVDAFQIHVQVDGWGLDNEFYDNELYLNVPEVYILNNSKGTATVYNNFRSPVGNKYIGNNIELNSSKEDLNKDEKIDLVDLAILSGAYGLKDGDAGYLEKFDLNNDLIIDIFDIVALAKKIV